MTLPSSNPNPAKKLEAALNDFLYIQNCFSLERL
jgi:hypothetical protein